MVSTRSHDGEVKGMDIVAKAESDPSHARSRKRKFGDVGEDLAKQSTIKPPKEKAMTATVSVEGGNVLAKHKRFGSEDMDMDSILETGPTVTNEQEQSQDEGDSEDDAPEAITAVAGFEASRAAAVDAARVAERQQTAARAKRRDLDSRLKAQAEAIKSRRQPEASKKTKTSLPKRLPDELLDPEAVARPPTPPSSIDRKVISKKMKMHDSDPKPLKDIRRGSKKIRVLQVETSVLPPRSSAASKAIRENWLMGQRGPLGGAGVPRRKMGIGFIRK